MKRIDRAKVIDPLGDPCSFSIDKLMGLTLSIGGSIGCHPAQGLETARPAEDAMRLTRHSSRSRHAESAGYSPTICPVIRHRCPTL